MTRFRCPCCGYYTLARRGKWEVCEVCYWEDEWGEEEYEAPAPDLIHAANRVSLQDARENFLAFGAKSLRLKPHVRPPRADEFGPGDGLDHQE